MQAGESTIKQVVMENLRDRYVGKGYTFFPYPGKEITPAFLETFRPDAIAIGENNRVVIKVETRRHDGERERLPKIASLFTDHPDWKFVVVFADEEPQDGPLVTAPRSRIEQEMEEAELLARQGRHRAALVLAWAALEAAARLVRLDPSEEQNRPKPSRQVLEQLESEGFLDHELARPLWEQVSLRDAVVHGDLIVEVNEAAVRNVLRAVQQVLAELPLEVRTFA